jgi:hypothetical protein
VFFAAVGGNLLSSNAGGDLRPAGSGLQPEPLVNVLRSFDNPLVQSARLNQPQKRINL